MDDRNVNEIAFTGAVKGKGFSEKTRNTLMDGTIHFIDYKDYRYTNIIVNGKLDKKLFNGVASMADENAGLTLNGSNRFQHTDAFF